tara:strand:- start:39 stop:491 length:453 start_codon:yes stop_codon:yes gene_type:complete
MNSQKEVNILNWHSEDQNFKKFIIYGFGKDIDGNDFNIQVNRFKPELYIRIRRRDVSDDQNNDFMKTLQNDTDQYDYLLDTLNFIASKPLKCKKITDKEKEREENNESYSSSEELEEESDNNSKSSQKQKKNMLFKTLSTKLIFITSRTI